MDKRSKILIVDDMEINREILIALLEDNYDIIEAEDGEAAINKITAHIKELSIILLDLMMPNVDGFQVLEFLRKQNSTVPVIIITANNELEHEKRGLSMGAVDFISKPFDPDIVRYRVNTNVKLKNYQDHLELLVEQKIEQMAEMWASVLHAMADIVETRNLESGLHIKRTSIITRFIVNELNKRGVMGYIFSPQDTRFVYEAASLHDIGKIGIPDSILTKPGKLTDEEFEQMKTHTIIGKDIANKITEFSEEKFRQYCIDICVYHHERWDGRGYPFGIVGTNIPLAARIISVADTYDAITNNRSYRAGRSHEVAIGIINEMRGTQFDPYIVDVFLETEKQLKVLLDAHKE